MESGSNEPSTYRGTLTRIREWILLEGRRSVVSAGLIAGILVILTLVSFAWAGLFEEVQPLYYAYGGLISGNVTLVTVVVSINQLLLSRELSTPDELRAQIEGSTDYHEGVEDIAGRAVPVEPQGFLRILFHNMRQSAQQLGGIAYDEADDEFYDEIDDIISKVTGHTDRVEDLLQRSDATTFSVLSTTLTTNYAREINHLRHLDSYESERLPDGASEKIDDLVNRLQDVDVARHYFKSVYLKQELALLSRLLVYTGLPAVTVLSVTLLIFTSGTKAAVPYGFLPVLFTGALTIGLFPMAVLVAFILRTATVTKRTAATLPFTAPAQEYH